MKNTFLFLVITFGIFIYSGCATLFTGTTDHVTFESKPAGARIYIDGLDEGNTPNTVRVRRSMSSMEITMRLDGYEAYTFKLKKEFNWVSILNLTDPLGWAIDVATGAMFKYKPKGYFIELEAKPVKTP